MGGGLGADPPDAGAIGGLGNMPQEEGEVLGDFCNKITHFCAMQCIIMHILVKIIQL